MKFIANIDKTNNHLATIEWELETSEQAYFAIAFLKTSGLKNLYEQLRKI